MVGICPEKFQLDQIQDGRLAAVINLNVPQGLFPLVIKV